MDDVIKRVRQATGSGIGRQHKVAIASLSLGRASVHGLIAKLDQARDHDIKGIELFYEDLEYVAREIDEKVLPETLEEAARIVRRLCDERGLEIIALQPFMHYEGLRDRNWHDQRISEMKVWIKLVDILGTNLIEVPSSFLHKSVIGGDRDMVVDDLRQLARLGLRQDMDTINFAYESLAWGTYTNRVEQSWEIVHAVDMPNFGICLDTFNIAARAYADPSLPSGCNPDAEEQLRSTIKYMKDNIDPQKIFIVQLADAERLAEPLIKGHEYFDPSQPDARMAWSRNCRLFYGERSPPSLDSSASSSSSSSSPSSSSPASSSLSSPSPPSRTATRIGSGSGSGYLPILPIATTILKDLRYSGYLSFEIFHKDLTIPDAKNVPENMACRAQASWKKFLNDLDLE